MGVSPISFRLPNACSACFKSSYIACRAEGTIVPQEEEMRTLYNPLHGGLEQSTAQASRAGSVKALKRSSLEYSLVQDPFNGRKEACNRHSMAKLVRIPFMISRFWVGLSYGLTKS